MHTPTNMNHVPSPYSQAEETPEERRGGLVAENYKYHYPFKPYRYKENEPYLTAPVRQYTNAEALQVIEQIKNNDVLTKAQRREMLAHLHSALSGMYLDHGYEEIVADDKPLSQYLELDGKRVAGKYLTEKVKEGLGTLKGEAAVRRVTAMLGMGRSVVWPLYHSGLVVTLGNFQTASLFNLQTRLLEAVSTLGRKTRGQIYTTDDVHILTQEVDFALDHVYECNLKNWTKAKIRKHLDVRDLHTLLCGVLACLYPEGYPFYRDCRFKDVGDGCDWSTLVAAMDVKNMVRLDFRQIINLDPSKFTRKQVRHLMMPMESVEEKDLVEYRDGFDVVSRHSNPINNEGLATYHLVLEAPMYELWRTEGLAWLGDVEYEVDRALEEAPELGQDEYQRRRQNYLNNFVARVSAQRHMSWVKAIVETSKEGEVIYDDRDTVRALLGEQSRDSEVYEAIVDQVERFKIEEHYSFVAIPNFECPDCGALQGDDKLRPSLIPVSVSQYFFGIMASSPARRI